MIPTLKNDNLQIREIKESDKLVRKKYGRDSYVMKMNGYNDSTNQITDKEVDNWFDYIQSSNYGWIIEKDKELIGQVRLNRLDNIDKNVTYSIGFFSSEYCEAGEL